MRVSLDYHLAKRHFFRVRGGFQPTQAEVTVPSAFFAPLGGANIVNWGAGREQSRVVSFGRPPKKEGSNSRAIYD